MDFLNNLITIVIASISYLIYNYVRRRYLNKKLPPGPVGLPLVGSLPFVGKHPERTFAHWSKKYGPIMTVQMGLKNFVILNDYETIYRTLLKKSNEFNGRPSVPLFDKITKGHGLILIDGTTPSWKMQRNFGISAFRELGSVSKVMEGKIIEETSYLVDSIKSHGEEPFEISHELTNAVANNLCYLTLGQRFDYDDPKFKEIIGQVSKSFSEERTNRLFMLLTFAPALIKLPPFSHDSKVLVSNLNAAFDLFRSIIKEHKTSCDPNSSRDFIDKFLIEMKKKTDESFSEFQLIQYVRDLFVAGTETTTTTLRWAILCLLHYPEVQRRLRKELDDVLGQSASITMSDKGKLPYLNAFIQEVFRFRTAVPISVFHKTTKDVEIDGYTIPQGTTIMPNIWAVHNDEKRWFEPHKFHPERHIDDSGKFVQSPYIIPFSIGGRHCLGKELAKMEIFLFLATLIQKFEFTSDSNATNPINIGIGSNGLVFTPNSFNIVAKEIY